MWGYHTGHLSEPQRTVMNHRLNRTLSPLVRCVLLVVAAGCGEPSAPGGPGQFHITVESGNADDAAAILELSGGGLGEITVVGGQSFSQRDGDNARVVIILDDPGTIDFSVDSDNLSQPPVVTIIEIADGNNRLRSSIAEYRTSVQPLAAVARSGSEE